MTALLLAGCFFVYWAIGSFTMWLGFHLFHEPGTSYADGGYGFWDGGYLWPALLPVVIAAFFVASAKTIDNWPNGPDSCQ